MVTTFLLGLSFLTIQINEYIHIGFAPQDSAQGTIFYSLTGLHGAHVFIGLCALAIVTIRSFRGHYSPEHHEGMEVPGIYWHFVDSCGWSSTRRSTSSRRTAPEPSDDFDPFRKEADAFRVLVWVVVVVAVIVAIVLIVRAVS